LATLSLALKTYVGVSGFSYPSWRGNFYPVDAKPEEFLALYAARLGSVEINSSFYAPPSAATVTGWSVRTPARFRFSFKAPKQVTHILKLGEGAGLAAVRFAKNLDSLDQRRGPILFQLPPFMKRNDELLRAFLTETGKIKERVFEFRHESWFEDETFRALEKERAGFCVAETEDMKPEFRLTSDLAYFRLRMDTYSKDEMPPWAKRITELSKGATACYVYLRHDETGANALLAETLAKRLSGL